MGRGVLSSIFGGNGCLAQTRAFSASSVQPLATVTTAGLLSPTESEMTVELAETIRTRGRRYGDRVVHLSGVTGEGETKRRQPMKVTAGAVLAVAVAVVASGSAAQIRAATDMTPTEAAAVLAPSPEAAAGDGQAPRAVCCAIPAKTPARAESEPPDGLKNFMTSAYYSNKIREAINAIPSTVLKRCAVTVQTRFTTRVLRPVTFGRNGLPNGGSWKQSLLLSGCGSQTPLNLYVSANKNEQINIVVDAPAHAQTPPEADGAFPLAGFYSASHQVNVEGSHVQVEAYLDIDRSGTITAYAQKDIEPQSANERSAPKPCFVLARGQAVNGELQGKTLEPGTAPDGNADYEVTVGTVTFGIVSLTEPARWFVHNGARNNTVNIHGERNVVTVGDESFSVSGGPMDRSAAREVMARMC